MHEICDVCQRIGKPPRSDEILLLPQVMLHPFDKWEVDFLGPINPPGKRTGAWYIIIAIDYSTRWLEATPVGDCTATTTTRFLFDNIVTHFGFPRILMSDQGSHFINRTVNTLTEELQIQHKKSTQYHPQENGIVEAFSKVLENALTNHNDWDLNILVVLWAYRTTCKILTGKTPFKLVYGKEAVMPMEYIVPSLRITATTGMDDETAPKE